MDSQKESHISYVYKITPDHQAQIRRMRNIVINLLRLACGLLSFQFPPNFSSHWHSWPAGHGGALNLPELSLRLMMIARAITAAAAVPTPRAVFWPLLRPLL